MPFSELNNFYLSIRMFHQKKNWLPQGILHTINYNDKKHKTQKKIFTKIFFLWLSVCNIVCDQKLTITMLCHTENFFCIIRIEYTKNRVSRLSIIYITYICAYTNKYVVGKYACYTSKEDCEKKIHLVSTVEWIHGVFTLQHSFIHDDDVGIWTYTTNNATK